MRCGPDDRPISANKYPLDFDRPALVQKRLRIQANTIGANLQPAALGGVEGVYNCLDVYLGSVDSAWLDVAVTLSAILDGIELPIATKLVRQGAMGPDEGGLRSVHLFKVRGLPARGFKLRAVQPTSAAADCDLRIAAWGQDNADQLEPLLAPFRPYDSEGNILGATIVDGFVRLNQLLVYNAAADTRFLQLFDLDSTGAPAAPDAMPLRLAANSHGALNFGERGLPFEDGLTWRSSTTQATFTAGGADMWVTALFSTP